MRKIVFAMFLAMLAVPAMAAGWEDMSREFRLAQAIVGDPVKGYDEVGSADAWRARLANLGVTRPESDPLLGAALAALEGEHLRRYEALVRARVEREAAKVMEAERTRLARERYVSGIRASAWEIGRGAEWPRVADFGGGVLMECRPLAKADGAVVERPDGSVTMTVGGRDVRVDVPAVPKVAAPSGVPGYNLKGRIGDVRFDVNVEGDTPEAVMRALSDTARRAGFGEGRISVRKPAPTREEMRKAESERLREYLEGGMSESARLRRHLEAGDGSAR